MNHLFYSVLLAFLFTSFANAQVKPHLKHEIMVPMRDGIKLATDIYFPEDYNPSKKNKYPVIFHRTPYNKEINSTTTVDLFCKKGYVVIFQDCRGRYKSEGKFTKYVNEPEDGYDAIEWIAKQPWCNGKTGMRGGSYLAHVQASAAKLNPPHLSTIILTIGGISNGWNHAILSHGAFCQKQLTWAFSNLAKETNDSVVKKMMKSEYVGDWFQALPLKRGLNPLSANPEIEDYIFEMLAHPSYDNYWKQMGVNWMEYYQQTSDIPMIHVSGWYDNYCQTAIDNYLGLSAIKKSPVRLMLGPWMHGTFDKSYSGDVDFGVESTMPDYNLEWHLRWYDHFLKGIKNGVENDPPVKVFVMGTGDGHKEANGRLFHGGYWVTSSKWPLPGTQYINYYLRENGLLSPTMPRKSEKPASYIFDPENPVPTIGGAMASTEPLWAGGAYDQREKPYNGDPKKGFYGSIPPYLPLKARKDVMVYQTPILEKDVQVIGPIIVKLHASSDCPDTDFTAKLVDVYPPSNDFPQGFEMNITDGIIRARYRNSPEKPELMEPGKVYEFTIEPFSTANVFKKGHRIRLDISSSNFPNFDVNPNTGDLTGTGNIVRKALNTIYLDEGNASYVILPIAEKTN